MPRTETDDDPELGNREPDLNLKTARSADARAATSRLKSRRNARKSSQTARGRKRRRIEPGFGLVEPRPCNPDGVKMKSMGEHPPFPGIEPKP
jgi:hypothetical protein